MEGSSSAPIVPFNPGGVIPRPTAATLDVAKFQQLAAETRYYTLEAERSELALERERREEAHQAASPDRCRVYTFYDIVDSDSVSKCLRSLSSWTRRDPEQAVTIKFNSPGGSITDGLALYDYIVGMRADGHHVETVGMGTAASMGGVLLQAGDHRVMTANCQMLIHQASTLAVGTLAQVEDKVAFTKRLQRRILAILAQRSTLTLEEIEERWERKDWWLDAEDALELGFIDAIR